MKDNLPKHIAIIMDGNGRWAREKRLPRVFGHRQGVERVKEMVRAAHKNKIKVLTLFAFSSENWLRPKKEIEVLMRYLDIFLDREIKNMNKNNIRFRVIGSRQRLPQNILKKISSTEEKTRQNTEMTLVLAIDYGSRQEIVEGIKQFTRRVISGKEKLEHLDEDTFGDYLYTAGLPDPDLMIRTSGELRISNFLLWQLSYAELYFPHKYWPDFRERDLEEAIAEYTKRQRRFGAISAEKENN
ncbi:MAG: isoprenyl transferase [Candidatus Omnitrophota bacterium]|nr:isoprenyl transferase [Candidatus Omnitrophota bacterium]